jgi:tRNA (mo5U34)-methyltransferase
LILRAGNAGREKLGGKNVAIESKSDGIWQRPDILEHYRSEMDISAIAELRNRRLQSLDRPHWAPLRELLGRLPDRGLLEARRGSVIPLRLNQAQVEIGAAADLLEEEQQCLDKVIRLLLPWRKGPFSLFGRHIDAEWRSDYKWSRLEPHLPDLQGKRILDVGCNNGYYMLRCLGSALFRGEQPECIVGVDPSESFYFSFELFQRFLQQPMLSYQLLGAEDVPLFTNFFDVVFCLGIVYHQRDPLSCLQGIRAGMRPGAQLLLESQVIPGDEPVALFSPDRYAKARNVYFVPTPACLKAWAERAGFVDAEIISVEAVTPSEQRTTELMPYESLADFLDPQDSTRTIEGFPAPQRAIVVARAR